MVNSIWMGGKARITLQFFIETLWAIAFGGLDALEGCH
jgi:hypothetical protein